MSDSLEKFVLQYTVELKDTVRRLEELQEKVEQTNKKAGESNSKLKDKFKEAFGDAKKSLTPLTEELGAMDGLIARIAARLGVFAPILAGIAFAVKSVMDVRKEYELQRKLGFESGLSPIGIESLQRQFNKSSGGVIGASGSRDLIGKIATLSFNAYTNPDIMNRDNLVLNKLGSSPFNKTGGMKDTTQILDEIGTRLRSVSEETARALGMVAGLSADEVKALRERTSAVKEQSKMSAEEVNRLQRQQQALEQIRNNSAAIQEDWRRIELVVGSHLMPLVQSVFKYVADKLESWQEMFSQISDVLSEGADNFIADLKHPFDKQAANAERQERATNRMINDIAEGRGKAQRDQERNAADQRSAQALFTRDINLFSSAVSTFAGVIDERQAWAAWAGEIGKAAGQSAPFGMPSLQTGSQFGASTPSNVDPSIFNQIYEDASKKYGIPSDILKAITKVESNFDTNAISNQGARGLNQIMPENFDSLGITDPHDPRQNIMGSAQLLKQYLTAAGGDLTTALTMYHGGYKRSGWGPLTRAYPGKVFDALEEVRKGNLAAPPPLGAPATPAMAIPGTQAATGHYSPVVGQSRQSLQYRQLQEAIAGYLNVPVEQVMQGGVNKGDVEFANKYLQIGTQRDYIRNMQMASTPGVRPNIAAEAMKNARAAAFQLEAFQKFGGELESKARPGGRDITLGQKNIVINIDGVTDPRSTAYEVRDVLRQDDINDINNLTATPLKY